MSGRENSKRSMNQATADAIDLDIFRLISRCERQAGSAGLTHAERRLWSEAASALGRGRYPVRDMMHPADEQRTRLATATSVLTEQGRVVPVPEAALAWLFGEGPDPSGHWFGEFPDDHPKPSGEFWWRKIFRAMIPRPPSPSGRA